MSDYWLNGPNRYVCSVLDEMRKLNRSLSHLSMYRYKKMQFTLIEEAQTLVNRMECGLEDWRDLNDTTKKLTKIKREVKEKRKELALLDDLLEEKKGKKGGKE